MTLQKRIELCNFANLSLLSPKATYEMFCEKRDVTPSPWLGGRLSYLRVEPVEERGQAECRRKFCAQEPQDGEEEGPAVGVLRRHDQVLAVGERVVRDVRVLSG